MLERAAIGPELSDYHVEAAIAWVHIGTTLRRHGLGDHHFLYDKLMAIRPSPIVALNRVIAIGQREGPQGGLDEIHSIQDSERLANYPFYHAALGELELGLGYLGDACKHFVAALKLARNPMERSFFERRIDACK